MTHQMEDLKKNSVGLALADTEWQDNHYGAMQPEYEEMLRWVGIQPGWKVLDAACGAGGFLPLMTELVGPTGEVHAIDLDPQVVDVVNDRIAKANWVAPVFARVGDLLSLPYDDGVFDVAWCANASEYLTDDQCWQMLRELKRVVRPGGLVAIKEFDVTGCQYQPCPPALWLRFFEAFSRSSNPHLASVNRDTRLGEWLRATGLVDTCQRPTLMVRFQPLRDVERQFIRDLLRWKAGHAHEFDLPAEDRAMWAKLADVDSPDHILNHADFQYRAIQTVFVGRVPPK